MFDPDEEYDDDRILLTATHETDEFTVTGYCSPDAKGRLFVNGGMASLDTFLDRTTNGGPFPMDVVISEAVRPSLGDIEPIREALGEKFAQQFEDSVDEVFDVIAGSDDPLEEIMQVGSEDL